jgi:hypothetical protein
VEREDQQQETGTPTISATDDLQPQTTPTPEPNPAEKPEATPDIMSKLPKTRPQRASDRRRASRPAAGATERTAAPSRAATPRPARAKATTPAAKRATSTPRSRTPARAPEPENASRSLPRVAIDGATEAAKLPLKVGGRLTLRGLDAIARGLRGK